MFGVYMALALSSLLCVSGNTEDLNDNRGRCERRAFVEHSTLAGLLQPLSQNMKMEDRLETFGNAVTNAFQVCSPYSTPFDDIEITSGKSYICATNGRTKNQASFYTKSFKFNDKSALKEDFAGGLDITCSYIYEGGFEVEFLNSYIKLPLAMALTGSSYIEFKEFNIDLTLTTEPVSKLVDKLSKKECFLYIKQFEASVTEPRHMLRSVNHESTYNFWQDKVNDLVLTEIEHIKEVLIAKVKAGFYEGIVNSGEWVCLDDNAKEVIDKKLTTTKFTVPSATFEKNCKNEDTIN